MFRDINKIYYLNSLTVRQHTQCCTRKMKHSFYFIIYICALLWLVNMSSLEKA